MWIYWKFVGLAHIYQYNTFRSLKNYVSVFIWDEYLRENLSFLKDLAEVKRSIVCSVILPYAYIYVFVCLSCHTRRQFLCHISIFISWPVTFCEWNGNAIRRLLIIHLPSLCSALRRRNPQSWVMPVNTQIGKTTTGSNFCAA